MPVMYLDKAVLEDITEPKIKKIIDAGRTVSKFQRLERYYRGEHDILRGGKTSGTQPDNKIVHNMPKYITDSYVGYFLGKPVIYSCDDERQLAELVDIFEYNDEQDHNTQLAKMASIGGCAYEMLYLDEDGRIRFTTVEPDNIIIIRDSVSKAPIGAIRSFTTYDLDRNYYTKVEFWTWTEVWFFISKNGGSLQLRDAREHFWQDVPFVEYPNNDEEIGDFEGVISENDAYNRVQSNTANVFEYNDDALLKVTGMGDVSAEDIREMKENGAIILEDEGNIDWLLKQINDTALENFKNRLDKDMHRSASVPNMADESFGNNLSGVAQEYKLWHMEQVTAGKERKFKKGLQRRIELITRIQNLMRTGAGYEYQAVTIQFRRNRPQNVLEGAQIFVMLASEVSRETRLKLLPFIENVQDELERLIRERKAEMDDFGSYERVLDQLEAVKHMDDEATVPHEGAGEAP